MKKIGIITPNGYYNYGNRLQNYALQEVLKSFDYDVETLIVRCRKPHVSIDPRDDRGERDEPCFLKRVINRPMHENMGILLKRVNRVLGKRKRERRQLLIAEAVKQREEKFIDFSRLYINEKDYSITGESFPAEHVDEFSYFVVGSDQVWNPFYHWGMTPTYWLDFAPKEKRISYAASFGVGCIPDEYKELYSNYLNNMRSLSVRELDGARLVTELTGREDVSVNVDPVLLLSKEHWHKLARPSSAKPSGSYILTYFLGTISDDVAVQINTVAKQLGAEVVNLAKEDDLRAYVADPAEFLDYINNADLFYTDSFHGSAFSVLFGTCFVVCPRMGSEVDQSMLSRIDTLLSMFDLKSRVFSRSMSIDEILEIDFSRTDVVLERERSRSRKYLTDIFAEEEAQ